LETQLVALAASAGTDADWESLEHSLERFSQAVQEGDDAAAGRAHAQFHVGIFAAIHQPALDLMLKPLTEVILVVGSASLVRNPPEDWQVEFHPPILDALKARDPAAAELAMVTHFKAATRPVYHDFLAGKFSDTYFDRG
jgi:DNA-binding GntR family transcriptional regulator